MHLAETRRHASNLSYLPHQSYSIIRRSPQVPLSISLCFLVVFTVSSLLFLVSGCLTISSRARVLCNISILMVLHFVFLGTFQIFIWLLLGCLPALIKLLIRHRTPRTRPFLRIRTRITSLSLSHHVFYHCDIHLISSTPAAAFRLPWCAIAPANGLPNSSAPVDYDHNQRATDGTALRLATLRLRAAAQRRGRLCLRHPRALGRLIRVYPDKTVYPFGYVGLWAHGNCPPLR